MGIWVFAVPFFQLFYYLKMFKINVEEEKISPASLG